MSVSNPPDSVYQRPQHALGKRSKRRVLCDQSHFRIYHESLIQDEQHSRFYQFPNDAFLFILEGQAYLSDKEVGLALNAHQGCWISPSQVHKLVLLSPTVELLAIVYQGNLAPCADALYLLNQAYDAKNNHLQKGNQSIKRHTLSLSDSLAIELEHYPKHQAEHLHYHRHSDQFVMVLEGELGLKGTRHSTPIKAYNWQLIKAKERHCLMNPLPQASLCLSIYSPPPMKDRVLVLKKKAN